MQASFELHSGSLRLHAQGRFGAPWDWICTVRPHPEQPHIAVLTGAATAPPRRSRRALAVELRRLGFTHFRFQRRKPGGEPRWVTFELGKLIEARS